MGMLRDENWKLAERLRGMLWPGQRFELPQPGMKRALIIGAGSGGRYIARELREEPSWNLWPIGFVDDDPDKIGRTIDRIKVLGDSKAVLPIVERHEIDVIIIAIPSAPPAKHAEISIIAKATDVEVVTMPPIADILSGKQHAETLRRVRSKDVLGRPIVAPDQRRCQSFIGGKHVLITGAAGSIGRELALQVARLQPVLLTILDVNESDAHDLEHELHFAASSLNVQTVIGSVTDTRRMEAVFDSGTPHIVFHAAAYKHVPLMERYPGEAVQTNLIGTRNVAAAAARHGAERFVLVSTDKAVRPTSVMGATKRLAEVALADISRRTGLSACSVRFGNVLSSRGSVIPTFERQIRAGGPVTVTDARMRRYFMTTEEAASLIIQSGAFGYRDAICILDMGEDVSILELAERVIKLHGLRPDVDIPIEITGIRPGEKLREELSNDFEMAQPSVHPKIRIVGGSNGDVEIPDFERQLAELESLAGQDEPEMIRQMLHDLVAVADKHEKAHGNRAAIA